MLWVCRPEVASQEMREGAEQENSGGEQGSRKPEAVRGQRSRRAGYSRAAAASEECARIEGERERENERGSQGR